MEANTPARFADFVIKTGIKMIFLLWETNASDFNYFFATNKFFYGVVPENPPFSKKFIGEAYFEISISGEIVEEIVLTFRLRLIIGSRGT